MSNATIDVMLHGLQTSLKPWINTLTITHLGGAVNDVGQEHSSYFYRKANFSFLYGTYWVFRHDDKNSVNAMRQLGRKLASTGDVIGYYVNYRDEHIDEDWRTAYHGDNWKRLVELKTKWDPDNFFHHKQSIPISSSPLADLSVDL